VRLLRMNREPAKVSEHSSIAESGDHEGMDTDNSAAAHPVLLCFDGSEGAITAISRAGLLLGPRRAVILTVWEPVADWEPYDPATILSAPLSRLASSALGLDEIANELAREKMDRGVAVATDAGFQVQGRVAKGKAWRTICEVAAELDAEPIVVGARGLSRVQSALLGSVSSAVVFHAKRPVLVVPAHGGG
jgi:nucleotide-binding universal stress UspA family protein